MKKLAHAENMLSPTIRYSGRYANMETIKAYIRDFGNDIIALYKPVNGKITGDYIIKKTAVNAIVSSYEEGNIDYITAMKKLVSEI